MLGRFHGGGSSHGDLVQVRAEEPPTLSVLRVRDCKPGGVFDAPESFCLCFCSHSYHLQCIMTVSPKEALTGGLAFQPLLPEAFLENVEFVCKPCVRSKTVGAAQKRVPHVLQRSSLEGEASFSVLRARAACNLEGTGFLHTGLGPGFSDFSSKGLPAGFSLQGCEYGNPPPVRSLETDPSCLFCDLPD
jgi:hypothetical protein